MPNFRNCLQRNTISEKAGYSSQIPLANKVLHYFELQNAGTTYSKDHWIKYIFEQRFHTRIAKIWHFGLKSLLNTPSRGFHLIGSVSLQPNTISEKAGYKSQIPLANKVLYYFELQNAETAYSKDHGIRYIFEQRFRTKIAKIWHFGPKSLLNTPSRGFHLIGSVSLQPNTISEKAGYKSQNPLANKVLH